MGNGLWSCLKYYVNIGDLDLLFDLLNRRISLAIPESCDFGWR